MRPPLTPGNTRAPASFSPCRQPARLGGGAAKRVDYQLRELVGHGSASVRGERFGEDAMRKGSRVATPTRRRHDCAVSRNGTSRREAMTIRIPAALVLAAVLGA